jgi:hypothetical protein
LAALRAWAERVGRELACLVVDLRQHAAAPSGTPTDVHGYLRLPGDVLRPLKTVACDARPEGAHAAVAELLAEAYKQSTTFRVGFLGPRRTFDELPETWEFAAQHEPAKPLWWEHPTVLHCAERLSVDKLRQVWSTRAGDVLQRLLDDPPDMLWVDTRQPQQIWRAVREGGRACCGFGFVPGRFNGTEEEDPLLAALTSGAPFVLWTEDEPDDWDALKEAVTTMVCEEPFTDLPARVRTARAAGQTPLAQLRLVWDEPDALPLLAPLSGLATAGGRP